MSRNSIRCTLSRTGRPVLGVGGGAFSNTFTSRFILDKKTLELKTAVFIKSKGPLACRHEQAIVPVDVGDYICIFSGARPADDIENVDIVKKGFRITSINDDFLYLEEMSSLPPIPKSVREGCCVYHNRDGSYFCKLPLKLIVEKEKSKEMISTKEGV